MGDIRQLLREAGSTFKGKAVTCPIHNDKNPSAGIIQGTDGKERFSCRVCNITEDYIGLKALLENVPVGDLLKAEKKPVEEKKLETYTIQQLEQTYNCTRAHKYKNQDGKIEMIVLRLELPERKIFIQCSPYGNLWVKKKPSGKLPLYNKGTVLNSDTVLIVEGEKCVEYAHNLGIVATTSSGGSGASKFSDWSILKGKQIAIWPDNDEPGKKYLAGVKSELDSLGFDYSVIDPDEIGCEPGFDIVDFMETIEDKKKAYELILGNSKSFSASDNFFSHIEDLQDNGVGSLEGPWDILQSSKYLIPGVMILCGSPGSGKTWLSLQLYLHLFLNGDKVVAYELEEDRNYYLFRLLAQYFGKPELSDLDKIVSDKSLINFLKPHSDMISELSKTIFEAPDRQVNMNEMIEWVETQAKDGAKFILIDPVTAMASEDKPWIADEQFILAVKTIANKYRTRVMLVTHPKGGQNKTFGLDSLAGGQAYNRFSQIILWIDNMDGAKLCKCEDSKGYTEEEYVNKTLYVLKGRGNQMKQNELGLMFRADTLTFEEKGYLK